MEKAMAPHSSTLAWKIPWMEDPGRLQSMGSRRVGHNWETSLSCIGEGNGNPLQCSCLENSRDEGAWWAAVYGVVQSQTWLKWLSSSSSRRNLLTGERKQEWSWDSPSNLGFTKCISHSFIKEISTGFQPTCIFLPNITLSPCTPVCCVNAIWFRLPSALFVHRLTFLRRTILVGPWFGPLTWMTS